MQNVCKKYLKVCFFRNIHKDIMQFCKDIYQQFNDFCRETTVHGFAYLADNNKATVWALWFFIVLTTFSFSILLIGQSFNDAKQHPILTTIDMVDVSEVPA